jgi:hypothetical protein
MLEALLTALWIGLSSATFTVIVRASPLVQRWMMNATKPWVCDVCMTFWMSLIAAGALWKLQGPAVFVAWPPGYAIGKWVLSRLTDPVGPAPELPLEISGSRPTVELRAVEGKKEGDDA